MLVKTLNVVVRRARHRLVHDIDGIDEPPALTSQFELGECGQHTVAKLAYFCAVAG